MFCLARWQSTSVGNGGPDADVGLLLMRLGLLLVLAAGSIPLHWAALQGRLWARSLLTLLLVAAWLWLGLCGIGALGTPGAILAGATTIPVAALCAAAWRAPDRTSGSL
jgi:hypothetical protein